MGEKHNKELITVEVYDSNKYAFRLKIEEAGADKRNFVIRWLVNQYNEKDPALFSQKPSRTFRIWVVYHEFEDIFRTDRYPFFMDYIAKDANEKLPIIHFTWFNVFKNIEEDNHSICDSEQWLLSNTPRYKKIMDSSIWNYYVPIFYSLKNYSVLPNIEKLHEALLDINHNESFGLYKLSIAHEYFNLHARILLESYLNGKHKAVSPFLFHSEDDMEDRILHKLIIKEKGKSINVIDKVKDYQWRFLLVDDKCINKISVGNNDNDMEINKLQIIAHNLSHILGFKEETIWFRYLKFDKKQKRENSKDEQYTPIIKFGKVKDKEFTVARKFPTESDKLQIIIDCVESIDDAKKCLHLYEYEIILLDYLLDNKKEIEYGYQLLEHLQFWHNEGLQESANRQKYKVGPNNTLAFMFISAFTTAVHERLIEMGLGRNERGLWHIGNSACPTNTPYLFSYLLLQMMRHRIETLRKETEGKQLTIIDLLEEIYVKARNSGVESVRKEANNHFNHLLFMRAKYKRLMKDFDEKEERDLREHHNKPDFIANYLMNVKSSLLVYSAFKVVNHFSEAFFDHLQHLVYLTAFGTIRQWQDMWEEYVFVYKELYDYDNYVVEYDEDKNVKKRGKMICNAIKEYIINLKENSI